MFDGRGAASSLRLLPRVDVTRLEIGVFASRTASEAAIGDLGA
jgi:hypothetical protein